MSSATALQLHPPFQEPDYASLVTEDDEPVDNLGSAKNQRLLTGPLYASWPGPLPGKDGRKRTFFAEANIGVFTSPFEAPIVPDAFLALDVKPGEDTWAKQNRSYFIQRMGKPPDVVIEIVSNVAGGELTDKKQRYAEMRVPWYVVFDPAELLSTRELQGFELRGRVYVRMPKTRLGKAGAGLWFDKVGLGLVAWVGVLEDQHDTWLRWCHADGSLVPNNEEEHRDKEAALARAEAERRDKEAALARAEAERRRAEDERRGRERLAARLRALGIDPDEDR